MVVRVSGQLIGPRQDCRTLGQQASAVSHHHSGVGIGRAHDVFNVQYVGH